MSELMVALPADTLQGLEEIERRVLWLASLIVHEPNERKDPAGIKVGGHQASSGSCVSILTALYFSHLTDADRIAVKPHAAPVLYAIQYLLGRLSREKLRQFRSFQGLQAYPSQTQNPDFVDYSTGSLGLGATAVNFSALTAYYLRSKGLLNHDGRFWAVVGDAELDEGSVWEALSEPNFDGIPGIRWVVDLNRQSLDRVIPTTRIRRLKHLFEANGWRVIEARYGRVLAALFAEPGGEFLKRRLDAMDNDEFQSVVSGPVSEVPDRLGATSQDRRALSKLLARLSPAEWHQALTNLGGHDQETLASAFRVAESAATPAVVFAHTIKGWKLPFAGHPLNHSALMSRTQLEDLAARCRIGKDRYERLDPASPGGKIVAATRARLKRTPLLMGGHVAVPTTMDIPFPERISSQQAFGRTLTALARSHPTVARRVVTASPDVSISTNLSGWINKVGAWHATPRPYDGRASRLLKWNEGPNGQHFELSLSEMNLFGLITQLGLSAKTFGPALAPIGTVYDCFIRRGLDALVYGLYCGSSFVIVGTPSGVSLAPEGGAHQSTLTPGLGVSLPGLISYEPCFAPEVEWTLLAGIDRALNQRGSTYLRLSTLPIDQRWFPSQHSSLRRQVLDGIYRLIDRRTESSYLPKHAVLIFATGAAVPAACEASNVLLSEGIFASVLNVTSADRLFRKWNSTAMATIEEARHQPDPFSHLLSSEEVGLPALMVADGHPHSLAFLGTALQLPSVSIGVASFGESGTVGDLFRKHHLDTESLVNAAIALLDRAITKGEVPQ